MAEIENILSRLERIFAESKLRYVIVGGIVIIHYGHIRTTQDVDIIIEDHPSKILEFQKLLKSSNFDVMEDQFNLGYKEGTNISVFDNNSFLRLDIKVANNKREYDVIDNAIPKKILGKILFIPPVEYVLQGKILFIGKIDDLDGSELLEYQDVIDFLTIYHANREEINIDLLNSKVKEIGLSKTLETLLKLKFE